MRAGDDSARGIQVIEKLATISAETVSAIMAEMGRKGGRVGGRRCLETMTAEARSARALHAARVRWQKRDPGWWRQPGATFTIRYPDGVRFNGIVDHLTKVCVWFRDQQYDSLVAPAARRISIIEFERLVSAGAIRRA